MGNINHANIKLRGFILNWFGYIAFIFKIRIIVYKLRGDHKVVQIIVLRGNNYDGSSSNLELQRMAPTRIISDRCA